MVRCAHWSFVGVTAPSATMNDMLMAALRALVQEYGELNWSHFGGQLAPIPLAVTRDQSLHGCYRADPRRIDMAADLLVGHSWGEVVEVLKHEMVHQFVYEVLGEREEAAHGPIFQRTCERLGVDSHPGPGPEDPGTAAVLARIQKLLALAGSPNRHEADTAMRAAHRLMLKYNLEPASARVTRYGFRQLGRPTGRISEAENLLASLLGEFFFVHPIWVSTYRVADQKRVSILEVTGREENLAMAEYVHGFLLHAAESLWSQHKRERGLRRNSERRTYIAGVMRGFAERLREERKTQAGTGLVWVGDPAADAHFRRRHPRVRSGRFRTSAGSAAAEEGQRAGKALVLNRPISEGGTGKSPRALPRGCS